MKKQLLTYLFALAFIFSASAQDYSGYTKCSEQDSLALVAFYNATDGANWFSNQDGFSVDQLSDNVLEYHTITYPYAGMGKWLEGPVKDWYGILMEKQQIGNTQDSIWRVIHLMPTVSRRDAGDNNLKGYIPREVGLLTALQWFKVNGNIGFAGTEVPDEVYHPTLKELDIENGFFTGIMSDKFRQCTELTYCNLRVNYLDSIPVFDFLTPDHLLEFFGPNRSIIFLYENQIPQSNIELSVKYFRSFSNQRDIQYEARKNTDVGREQEIIVETGGNLTLTTNVGGEEANYVWYKNGFSTYKKSNTYTKTNVTEKDTGAYKVLIDNPFILMNDQNEDNSNKFSKNIYVRFAPVKPTLLTQSTSYNGKQITLKFSKPMAIPVAAQKNEFVVTSGGKTITVTGISRTGYLNDTYLLELESPTIYGEEVKVVYNNGTVTCTNGGQLNAFDIQVLNKTRVTPSVVEAITRKDGSGIFVTFDEYIDAETIQPSDFNIEGSNTSIRTIVLNPGEIDDFISKTIELVLSGEVSSTDNITISYARGKLTGLYGGTVQSFEPFVVTNIVEENKQDLTITVEDGTGLLTGIAIGGNIKSLPFELFDDGTNGDQKANDHIWCKTLSLSPNSYTWTVFKRNSINSFDTIQSTGENGQIFLEITPTVIYEDSLISGDVNLNLKVTESEHTGDTYYGYRNKKVTFILDLSSYLANNSPETIEPYLMGISGDWTTGILMTLYDQNRYIAQNGGYNPDEQINFNFRVGDTWENDSPQKRIHTIIGNDTIYAEFGVVTNINNKLAQQNISIYPNPAQNELYIAAPENTKFKEIKIYNQLGKCVMSFNPTESCIDISQLKNGLYLIMITDENNNRNNQRFLKKY